MIRILLAHPSRLVCDSLRTALDKETDVYVVGCATTAEELHFLLPHGNIVLLGTELEDATAFTILEEMRITYPQTKVLIMGVDERPETIIRYIEAGAAGYILQNDSMEDMLRKLQAAYAEKAIISPSVAAAMMDRLCELASLEMPVAFMKARETQFDELTSREHEVLTLITDGRTNQEIAEELIIECGTVKNHVHNILKKLEVNNRHEAASIFHMYQQSVGVAAL
ncbi:MAG: response regulator transcription factor [Anaerolineales bacterium]|nr:response regulator transcription factor [Anaerolineales bacterium]MCA9976681.1 response regulator transcription factor [Anaerolineales bacterium]